jgi:3-isopropylmalate dehydrogenase
LQKKEEAHSYDLSTAKIYSMLPDLSPLKPSIIAAGVNMVIVRELISGIYFGEHETKNGVARDVMKYSEDEVPFNMLLYEWELVPLKDTFCIYRSGFQ